MGAGLGIFTQFAGIFFSLNAYFLFSRHLTLHDSFLYFPFLVNVVIVNITIIIVIIIKLLLL